ncbi:hypothetical protein J1N35_022758 [Gossypium stocksii]|uniref:Aminotransferase-like plant mobile domain-containing protein n=1 Tax=Gossypium stocksii TaxID=47602 RepID=A0A9D3VIC0_9ROSI|nr:hypothetical protein J1N35_022758 [Gossypium stocksii]
MHLVGRAFYIDSKNLCLTECVFFQLSLPQRVLVERWRLKIHTFHLPYGECTTTLEDVALQLDLPMNEPVTMGLVVVPSKEDLCKAFLRKVSNKFQGGQIEKRWLQDNFKYLPSNETDVMKEQFAQTFILKLTGGILMLDKSRNLVHIR